MRSGSRSCCAHEGQALSSRAQEAAQDARPDQGLPRAGPLVLQAGQGDAAQGRLLRLPRPAQPQARLPAAVDHAHQRRRPPRGHVATRSSCTACARPGSSWTARCWPTSPCATPRRSDVLPSKPGRRWPRPYRINDSRGAQRGALFRSHDHLQADNEQLKTIRKLQDRRWRDKLGPVRGRGGGPRGRGAAGSPEFVLRAGRDVEPELLDEVSTLGSGTRVIGVYEQRWSRAGRAALGLSARRRGPGQRGGDHSNRPRARRRPGGAGPGLRGSLVAEGGAGQHGLDLRPAARAGEPAGQPGRARSRTRGDASATWTSSRRSPSVSAREREGLPTELGGDAGEDSAVEGARVAQRGGGGRHRAVRAAK